MFKCRGLHKWEHLDWKPLMKRGILQLLIGDNWQHNSSVAITTERTSGSDTKLSLRWWKYRKRCAYSIDCWFHQDSPFNKQLPSFGVMWVFSRCRPAVLQQQLQVLVLMFENRHLHIHGLAKLSHCRGVSGWIERPVIRICRWNVDWKYYYLFETGPSK